MKPITISDKYLEAISKKLDRLIELQGEQPDTQPEEVELNGRWTCYCGRDFATERALKTHKTKVHK